MKKGPKWVLFQKKRKGRLCFILGTEVGVQINQTFKDAHPQIFQIAFLATINTFKKAQKAIKKAETIRLK